jgi:hypothetical protein
MKRKKRKLGIFVTLIIIVLMLHSTIHFSLLGKGVTGFFEKGILGFSIGKFSIGEDIKDRYQAISPASKIILIGEWAILILVIVTAVIKSRVEIKKELSGIKSPHKYKSTKKSTDLDALFNLLKEKKHLRLSSIAKAFKIDKDLALSWSRTLESAQLVSINYPKFGDPEVVLEE